VTATTASPTPDPTTGTPTPDPTTGTPTPGTPGTARRSSAGDVRPRPHLGRRLAAVGLVAGAALNTAEAVLGQFLPRRPESVSEQVRLVGEHAGLFGARTVIGTLAVPLMVLAFLAAAKAAVPAARRTAVAAAVLLLAGMWGFLGMHVVTLLQLPAARVADPSGAAALLTEAQADPVLAVLFLLPFLAGCALGLLLLVVALFRTPGVPRWIPAAWLAFLVLDFAVRPGGPVDPHWLFLIGAVGLAAQILRGRVAAFA
jgi:hypothetical protein